MKRRFTLYLILLFSLSLYGQSEVKSVRNGNRLYSKGKQEEAEIQYRRALESNPNSLFAKYNLGNALYKGGNSEEAQNVVSPLLDSLERGPLASKILHNLGNYALDKKEYKEAIEHFKSSLRINPSDFEKKSNLAYAQSLLEEEENQEQQQDQEQDQDQNPNQDQDQNQDQNQDPNQDQDQDQKQEQNPQPKISPQSAQQMLQALQAKERETQEKVEREKAKALARKVREKNW